MAHPHPTNAPITEALIDIQVELEENFDPRRFEALAPLVSDRYPSKNEKTEWKANFQFQPGSQEKSVVENSATLQGFLFSSEDNHQVFQARTNGFTLNRLKPYSGWDSIREEAEACWKLYSHLANPKVKRLSLRYLNRIEFSLDSKRIDTFFQTYPKLGEGIHPEIASLHAGSNPIS